MDGDVYMCIWDQTFIEELKEVHKPAMYAKFEESIKPKEDADIVDYITEYFQKDNLGHLANLHLALCD